jgi:aarF domain-containing kinase
VSVKLCTIRWALQPVSHVTATMRMSKSFMFIIPRGHRSQSLLHLLALRPPCIKPIQRSLSTEAPASSSSSKKCQRCLLYPVAALLLGGVGYVAYEKRQPFRHAVLAVVRCSRVARTSAVPSPPDSADGNVDDVLLWADVIVCAEAAIAGAIDYKRTFAHTHASEEEKLEAYSQCHTRSAKRVLKALLANGGMSVFLHAQMQVAHVRNLRSSRCFHKTGSTCCFVVRP